MPCLMIRLYGIVQGVGFRPFVSRAADSLGVVGTVANKGSYVEIFAKADAQTLERFVHIVKNETPERAVVISADVRQTDDIEFTSFDIIESEKESGDIFVSPLNDGRRAMDKELGWFHACSAYPTSDIKIKIPII